MNNRGAVVPVGLVAALVGFTSSFAVVLAGLQAVGATTAQAASGLVVLCVLQGLGSIWLSLRHHVPVTLAWSTPGAALLASTGAVGGGWAAAVGAFAVTGVLIMITGLWTRLGDLIAAIPVPIAQAMLAGVLLPLCLAPVDALTDEPAYVVPIVVVWLVMQRVAALWATPLAFALALTLITVDAVRGDGVPFTAPTLDLTSPTLSVAAIVGIALPLYLVTMASQNVPGTAVLASAGYTVPWRESLLVTGGGTIAGAAAGAHAVNLAAITAALPASPEAHPDPSRRYLATVTAGWAYVVLALVATTLTALVAGAPPGVVQSVAGLALLGTLAGALNRAVEEPTSRVPATVTFLVAASGFSLVNVGAAFWALVAGLVLHVVLSPRPAAGPPASG